MDWNRLLKKISGTVHLVTEQRMETEICQEDNNSTTVKKTTQDNQSVFNTAKKYPGPGMRPPFISINYT